MEADIINLSTCGEDHCKRSARISSISLVGVYAQTADFSVTRSFPVYDAWGGLICARAALIWLRLLSKLSAFRANYGKFALETIVELASRIFRWFGRRSLFFAEN
jgi:hypothetical protein